MKVAFAAEGGLAQLTVEPERQVTNLRRAAAGPLRVAGRVGADRFARGAAGTETAEAGAAEAGAAPVEASRPEGGAS